MAIEEVIRTIIIAWLSLQITYSIIILIFGNMIVDYYKLGVFEKPTNIFTKIINFLSFSLFGFGPYLHDKLSHHSWIKRKLLMLSYIILGILVSIIFYNIIKLIL